MPDHYCQECGAELDNDTSYCSDCGAAAEVNDVPETTDRGPSEGEDLWEWSDPRGPFRTPRRALGTLNVFGFISFLLAVGLNTVGLPITALPDPLPITIFLFWLGVLVIGLPLWGLLHVTDNVLGFLRG